MTARPLRTPGILLGVRLGGFVDGILLHQLLQWHHMLTSTDTDNVGIPFYPADTVVGLRMNTVWAARAAVAAVYVAIDAAYPLSGRRSSAA